MLFKRRTAFSSRLKFDAGAFNEIVRQLREAGFVKVEVKIPEHYKNFPEKTLSPEEFLNKHYNFVALILCAEKSDGSEGIKILFVNHSQTKSVFSDQTFPSSHSESPKYSIHAKDPVRLLGLGDFTRTLLETNSIRSPKASRTQNALAAFATLYILLGWIFAFSNLIDGLGVMILGAGPIPVSSVLILLLVVSPIYLFIHMLTPGGLYVMPFEHPIASFSKRIFVGDLRDNPIVVFIFFIFKLAAIGLFGSIFYNVVWALLGDKIMMHVNALL